MSIQQISHLLSNLVRQQGRYCVSYLPVLVGFASLEEVIVREGLQPGSFSHRQAPALGRVIVNIIVPILANVIDDSS